MTMASYWIQNVDHNLLEECSARKKSKRLGKDARQKYNCTSLSLLMSMLLLQGSELVKLRFEEWPGPKVCNLQQSELPDFDRRKTYKSFVSVDYLVNWSDHAADKKTGEVEKAIWVDGWTSMLLWWCWFLYCWLMSIAYDGFLLSPDIVETISDKSSDSKTYASCDSSLKTKTKDFPPAVDIKTMPESDVEVPNSTTGSPSFSCLENVKSPRILCNKSGMNNRNVCKNNYVRVKKCFVCGSKLHLIKDCDFYNCVDSVPCKSKAASVPAGSRNSSASVTAGGSDSAASRNRPAVNSAGRPNPTGRVGQAAHHAAAQSNPAGWSKRPAPVSAGRPVSAGWLNPAARPYFRPSSVYFNNMYWPDLYDPMYMNKGRWGTAGDPSTDNDIGIVDSGCSRSMTGNKEKLDDFVQVKGGIVKFGGGDGRISGKGTIRTSKLDFENVYYVEELQHFNLFSVSQICDKKNKVLFTDTDCLVLTEEFQLPDESQVVLRIPRERDLYTFSISELQPEQNVTCLVAKASLDESTRWHRRMAHVNFKTINKLAKEGLVDGLPLKVFTNEHNCVACNKGKQHKASYKHISAVRLITETLQNNIKLTCSSLFHAKL
ncbi:ribonuclease H-like domain-containing protein [Tanacetum coccineum]|uniref:Ribonuclease H-like domain-containing protein n=1 Tax=Tanacetum coccineum TaxID=301880 RepID=A0ABQ5G9N0_9ASTR